MSKTIKNCFYKKLTYANLMSAYKRAKKHKTHKREVIEFEINLENNITNLLNNIKSDKYKIGKYYQFKIYEPKERIISALPFVDRIVHQWYVEEFIKPNILPKLINTTFACIPGRGTHLAVEEVQNQMRKVKRRYGDFWILKCDIKKYFYNIDPNILFNIMTKYISDKKLLGFTHLIIFDGRVEKVGIPIGNYTSQFFANIYLNKLDQFVKNKLHIKYYTRYMDDFVLLLKSKTECIEVKKIISKFLWDNLRIELNAKSRYYPYKMGVNFCGYRIFTTHMLLRTNSKKKIKKKLKQWNRMYNEDGYFEISDVNQSLNSWLGHAKHCNSYKLATKIINNCDFYTDEDMENVEARKNGNLRRKKENKF